MPSSSSAKKKKSPQPSPKPISRVVVVSVKDTTVDELLQHLQSLISPWTNYILEYTLNPGKGARVHGHLRFRDHFTDAKIKSYTAKISKTALRGRSIHAHVDNSAQFLSKSSKKTKQPKPNTDLKPTPKPTRPMEDAEEKAYTDYNQTKQTAVGFFHWLHAKQQQQSSSSSNNMAKKGARASAHPIDLALIDRETVHHLFQEFASEVNNDAASKEAVGSNKSHTEEALVMTILRQHKLCRSKRYSDGLVFCSFANREGGMPPLQERVTQREALRQRLQEMQTNKGGVCVSEDPLYVVPGTKSSTKIMVPPKSKALLKYTVSSSSQDPMTTSSAAPATLLKAVHIRGRHRDLFRVQFSQQPLPTSVVAGESVDIPIAFHATGPGVRRAVVVFEFQQTTISKGAEDAGDPNLFTIHRPLVVRVGNAQDYDILQPTTPYEKKKKKRMNPKDSDKTYQAPEPEGSGKSVNIYKDLPKYKVPVDVRTMVECGEMERTIVPPAYDDAEKDFGAIYSTFWKKMLYMSELQAYKDIETFDMEQATLQRHGKYFSLTVSGLAEGRPSVLRGDMVLCTWRGKQYQGRVVTVQLLQVHLQFHAKFHETFDPRVDRVDLVRFTFGRTIFRTSHKGAELAPHTMGQRMLFPKEEHVEVIEQTAQECERVLPRQGLRWKTRDLNEEQKDAIRRIAKGRLRPLPFVVFGPPGTGKTTTVVETVYQLANLCSTKTANNSTPKILLVAPSNDATDILVERLSEYFEPMQMMRVLAYTRSIDQVPPKARRYVREGLEGPDLAKEMTDARVRIVVSTVNLAARFWCMGVRKGHFDVLVVDEAGHTTEPEVIATATTLLNFGDAKNPAQLILAGDPMQLGPVITSDLCKKFGMGVSYMERLVKTSPAYRANANAQYPPDLVSFLKQNYRSHPSILKLPNEMFYHNKLVCSGDIFKTGSFCQWEHLPCKNFPILFHGIDGENLREGTSPSWFNPQEAMEVANYVDTLMNRSKPSIKAEEIGIITPYARQVQKIRLLLEKKGHVGIKVGSVETFQGQERRCIIVSTVRSETQHLEHDRKYNLGFVANEKRFNVAITRAMALLIVVGNPRVLATDKKNWLPFLAFCKMHGAWNGEEWGNDPASDGDEDDDQIDLLNGGSSDDEEAGDSIVEPSIVVTHEATGFLNREE